MGACCSPEESSARRRDGLGIDAGELEAVDEPRTPLSPFAAVGSGPVASHETTSTSNNRPRSFPSSAESNEHDGGDENSNETQRRRRHMKDLKEQPLSPVARSPVMNPLCLPRTLVPSADTEDDGVLHGQQSDNGRSIDEPQAQNSARRFTGASATIATTSSSNQFAQQDDRIDT